MRTHYEVLGVAESATELEVRAAYRVAARRSHPDSGGEADAMRRVNQAWHVLQDPGRRAAYDRELTRQRRLTTPPMASSGSGDTVGADGLGRRPEPGSSGEDASPGWGAEAAESWSDDPWGADGPGPPAVEGWLALLPPAFGALAAALFGAGFLFAAPALFVFAVGALFVSLCLFVLVPLLAMSRSTSPRRNHRED